MQEEEEEAGVGKGELPIPIFWHHSVNKENFSLTKMFEDLYTKGTCLKLLQDASHSSVILCM